MARLHHTAISFFHVLQSLFPAHVDILDECVMRDESMQPTIKRGEKVHIDRAAVAKHKDIIAVATDDFMDIRELQIFKGEVYLVAHNRSKRFARISMKDYKQLYPGASVVGVVC